MDIRKSWTPIYRQKLIVMHDWRSKTTIGDYKNGTQPNMESQFGLAVDVLIYEQQ